MALLEYMKKNIILRVKRGRTLHKVEYYMSIHGKFINRFFFFFFFLQNYCKHSNFSSADFVR